MVSGCCRRCFSCCSKGVEENVSVFELVAARKVQFIHPLINKLTPSTVMICTGTPGEEIPWFSVNIGSGTAGSVEASDLAVHFNVRMPQSYVVRNNRRREAWGVEETTAFRSFPFKVGRKFVIEALFEEKESLWAVDGEYYCSFKYRNPTPMVCAWVQITGIKDAEVHVERAQQFPIRAPVRREIPFRPELGQGPYEEEPQWTPNTIAILPNGIKPFNQVVLIGKLRPMLHSFSVDLMEKAREWPRPNIHVHVNVRPYDQATHDRQLVVLNSWFGSWGQERRQRSARLVPGSTITLRIVFCDDVWSVYADNLIIGEMESRGDSSEIEALRLRGDFNPQQIYWCSADTPGGRHSIEKRKSKHFKKQKVVITTNDANPMSSRS